MTARNGRTGTGKKQGGTRRGRRSGSAKKSAGLIFWAVFFLVVAFLFLANREAIRRTLQNTGFLERLSGRPKNTQAVPPPENTADDADDTGGETRERPAAETESPVPVEPDAPAPAPESPVPVNPPAGPALPAPQSRPPQAQPETRPEPPAARPAPESRERGIYFIRIDRDGTILRTRTARKIPASDSPMMDALGALLAGPTAEEQRRELRSFIPEGTRILSATVRGGTAYISFSEEFQYNTYGVEGYAAQLRQIVWTATEFANVTDVQILIEGRRVDYLGEGIWIGSPLGRDAP
ncbi:MAG: GerMN domain-containing protein [Treponema sp.]|nr:GerMN domain-containing protein [Treponema sp.]